MKIVVLISKTLDKSLKNLSEKAKTPRRATKGSVGYVLYSVEFKSISSQECGAVATDISSFTDIFKTVINPGIA